MNGLARAIGEPEQLAITMGLILIPIALPGKRSKTLMVLDWLKAEGRNSRAMHSQQHLHRDVLKMKSDGLNCF